MKTAMSNIDIRLMISEIAGSVEGSFIKNIYQYGDIFVLKLYQSGTGTHQLLIQPGRRIHFTEYRRVAPRMPTKFTTVLRKYLREARVQSIRQHDLDRIVIIDVGSDESSYKLVVELFGNGNLLLLDSNDTIFVAMRYRRMKDRDVVPKATYEFPPPRGVDVLSREGVRLKDVIQDSNANVVRTLASRLNLDAQSCEEICALAGIPGTLKVQELDEDGFRRLETGLDVFVERVKRGIQSPCIVEEMELDDEEEDFEPEPVAFIPFQHEIYGDFKCEAYDSFSQAIDEFFGVSEAELEDEVTKSAQEKERSRLQRIIEKQQESIDRLTEKAEKERKRGELIYAHFQIVQDVLNTINNARNSGRTWANIIETVERGKAEGNAIAKLVKRIVPNHAMVVVTLNDMDVPLDIRLSAQDNASRSYEQAKRARSKIEGAEKQIEKTKVKLEKLEEKTIEVQPKKEPMKLRKRKWYEKFRWFFSSDGNLVLGGRDAKSNERLAKRHMSANDVFLHASVHGAPYVIIKVPDREPSERTLYEAAQFAVTFSRAWQDGLSSGDAYWLPPEQVSFSPPSGEYLPSGAVMLYGKKNYINNVPIELAVGVIIEEDSVIPMSGPVSAVEAHCKEWVKVVPSQEKKGQLVKDIIHSLRKRLPEEQRHLMAQITQEDIMRLLPPGGGRIVD